MTSQHPIEMSVNSLLSVLDPVLNTPEALCTEQEIYDLLRNLDTRKASGPDGDSARMLKETAIAITEPLTKLFNLSILSGIFLSEWKLSNLVPIPKTRSKSDSPTDYRPISLLAILSKVREKHFHYLITEHMMATTQFTTSQWGFQYKKSTITALYNYIGYIPPIDVL